MSTLVFLTLLLGVSLAEAVVNLTTVYGFEQRDWTFKWESEAQKAERLRDGKFKPEFILHDFMAVHGDRVFLSLYNELGSSHVTLVWLPTSSNTSAAPQLVPFPSWKFHNPGNCSAIQQAGGIEVDTRNRLWVLDNGGKNCPAKLWIFNLADNDKVELVHEFPKTVITPSEDTLLRDIVLDETPDDWLAYAVQMEANHIVAFSLKDNASWLVKIPGHKYRSIALSPKGDGRQLFVSDVYGEELYEVSVSEVRARSRTVSARKIFTFSSQPYRMLINNANLMYVSFAMSNYMSTYNVSANSEDPEAFYRIKDFGAFKPFTFALDAAGTLWLTDRNQSLYDIKPQKYSLLKVAVGARSYLYAPGNSTQ